MMGAVFGFANKIFGRLYPVEAGWPTNVKMHRLLIKY